MEKVFMKNIVTLTLICLLASCIPDSVKKEVNDNMAIMQQAMADREFKHALSSIEMHKIRNGHYPDSLGELRFLSALDSSLFNFVTYKRMDSVYELNVNMEFPTFDEKQTLKIKLAYPPEFWNGLGCVQSNAK